MSTTIEFAANESVMLNTVETPAAAYSEFAEYRVEKREVCVEIVATVEV